MIDFYSFLACSFFRKYWEDPLFNVLGKNGEGQGQGQGQGHGQGEGEGHGLNKLQAIHFHLAVWLQKRAAEYPVQHKW